VGQHSTGHNQQPNQLYAKKMCRAELGKWWSHQILVFWSTPLLFFKGICDQQMHICIPSHVKSRDFLMNLLRLTDFLTWSVTQ
jgi:hypothetical protein